MCLHSVPSHYANITHSRHNTWYPRTGRTTGIAMARKLKQRQQQHQQQQQDGNATDDDDDAAEVAAGKSPQCLPSTTRLDSTQSCHIFYCCKARGPHLRRTRVHPTSTFPFPSPLHAATALLGRLDLTERKLRVLLMSSIAPSSDRETSVSPDPFVCGVHVHKTVGPHLLELTHACGLLTCVPSPHTQMAAMEYLVSTLTSEMEAEQIMSIEDVFGVIQVIDLLCSGEASRKEGDPSRSCSPPSKIRNKQIRWKMEEGRLTKDTFHRRIECHRPCAREVWESMKTETDYVAAPAHIHTYPSDICS